MNGLARLQRLKEILVEVSNEHRHFDMRNWTRLDCHTASCAAGHAAFDPVLMAEGFKIDRFGRWPVYKTPEIHAMLPPLTGFAACAVFFELTIEKATRIFGAEAYSVPARRVTPEMVIARIDEILGTSHHHA